MASQRVDAQAFDARNLPGEGRTILVHLNRHPPAAVTGLAGGYNATHGVVDMRWQRYGERDLQGYRVTRELDDVQVCPASGSVQDGLSCTDTNPPEVGSSLQGGGFRRPAAPRRPTCALRPGVAAPSRRRSSRPPAMHLVRRHCLTAIRVDGKPPTVNRSAPTNRAKRTRPVLQDLPHDRFRLEQPYTLIPPPLGRDRDE